MHTVLSLILGGGRGARLWPLTKHRSEPAVPIAGKYRLIDVPISNCINSGVTRIYVLTQYLSVSLHRHIANTYKFDPFSRGSVEVLAAQQTNETADWYVGTADALRQNIRYLQAEGCRDVLVLSGDQLYRMDFRELLRTHHDSGADATMAVLPVTAGEAHRLGIVRTDASDRIIDLVEKPQRPEQLPPLRSLPEQLQRRGIADPGKAWLGNMGIYLFRMASLCEMLAERLEANDLVTQLCQPNLARRHIQAHLFQGYWQDLGNIGTYHAASLALAGNDPPFDFARPEGSIYTHMRDLPAARVSGARVAQCLISDGCFIEAGAEVTRSVIGIRTRIGRGSVLRDTVINGADHLETDAERSTNREHGQPDLGVGDECVIERAIVDKGCRIGRRVQVRARPGRPDEDGTYHHVRDGIVVIPRGTAIPDGTVL
jgi:glucose-1-phosphate adenylyltransferase